MHPAAGKKFVFVIALLVASLILAAAVTYTQVSSLGIHFLRVQQEKVHVQMMQGVAGNPWQYRILADALMDPFLKLAKNAGWPQPESLTFIAFRFLQCLLIFTLAGVYYRRLGLLLYESLIGLSILAWSMSLSLYNSDLSFNVFFDIAFYLLAATLILNKAYWWTVLLMVPAALNRETCVLIPFAVFFAARTTETDERQRRWGYIAAGTGLLLFAVISIGLRIYYAPQQFLTADGLYPGLGLFVLNLSRGTTWEQLAITLSIIPLLALFAYRAWPASLKVFFWVIVPAWLAIHLFAALVAETRLLLVPQAVVFIPGALFGLAAARAPVAGAQDAAQ